MSAKPEVYTEKAINFMSRSYRIQFDSIYLTSDGTNAGEPVKVAVGDPSALKLEYTGTTIETVGGAVNQLFKIPKPVEIRVLTHLSEIVWEAIVALINTALENSATINIKGVGDIGDFDIDALPLLPRPFEAQDFANGRIKTPIFRFITV